MNKIIITFAVALLIPQITLPQGTMTYLSNLNQASAGSFAVGSDSWLAALFVTGTNASGYTFDSFQLGMADASGSPIGFTVMLYTAFTGVGTRPGSNLGTLDGSLNPTAAGIYTYIPAANITLSPGTQYFVVLTAGTTIANGAYEWDYANTYSYNPSSGWEGGPTLSSSSGSSFWRSNLPGDYPEFAINATAIPEPGVLCLFGLGGLAFLWHRRKLR
jgi:hypothetical protein